MLAVKYKSVVQQPPDRLSSVDLKCAESLDS